MFKLKNYKSINVLKLRHQTQTLHTQLITMDNKGRRTTKRATDGLLNKNKNKAQQETRMRERIEREEQNVG